MARAPGDGARGLGAALILAALMMSLHGAAGDVLSASSLEACVRDGSSAALQLECSRKLVVTLTLDGGNALATEELNFAVGCVGRRARAADPPPPARSRPAAILSPTPLLSPQPAPCRSLTSRPSACSPPLSSLFRPPRSPTGRCPCPCDYATDAGCGCRDLSGGALGVSLTKSPVTANYPLTYLKQFNYKPYEVMLRPNSGTCSDDPSTATCGAYYYSGDPQADSEGFCCSCSLGSTWDATLGGAVHTCVAAPPPPPPAHATAAMFLPSWCIHR
jgi:hypothetical protein